MTGRETSMGIQVAVGLVFALACVGALVLCVLTRSIWWMALPFLVGVGIAVWPGWSSRPRPRRRVLGDPAPSEDAVTKTYVDRR